jgi:uncharacterized protein (TIGR00661 family)
MAKIAYGIAGEGNGHAIRSKVVIAHLKNKHTVQVVCGKRVQQHFKKPTIVVAPKIHYFRNCATFLGTMCHQFFGLPQYISSFIKTFKLLLVFKPDVIITDFEPWTAWSAALLRIPIISLDNQHMICSTAIKYPVQDWWSYIKSRLVIFIAVPFAKARIITTFFEVRITSSEAILVGPVLRPSITRLKPTKKGPVLVYQTSDSNQELIKALKRIPEKFVIYGFDRSDTDGNLQFRKFNETVFFTDLARSRAVIANGGFTLLTEALYLGKPVLSIPVEQQFEQLLNANYLRTLGIGSFSRRCQKEQITRFLGQQYSHWNNTLPDWKKAIDKTITRLTAEPE